MKIDIEGAEEAFFQTADTVLDKVERLVIELHPKSCDVEFVKRILEKHYTQIEDITGRINAKPVLYCKN